MKIFISGLLLFFVTGLFGQTTEWKKCGFDNSPKLNEYETKYFNEVFQYKKDDFDFTGKTIAYYKDERGTTKSNYFKNLKSANNGKDKSIHEWQAGGTQLLILTEEEKEISGGYDAILVSWSKLLKKGNARLRLVKRLK